MINAATMSAFGECTPVDLAELDKAVDEFRHAQEESDAARRELGAVMARLLKRGAQRRAIANRVGVTDQTVSNLAHGRPSRKQ